MSYVWMVLSNVNINGKRHFIIRVGGYQDVVVVSVVVVVIVVVVVDIAG